MITATVLGLYWLSTFIKSALSFTLPTNISTTINQVSDFPRLAVWRCLLVRNFHPAYPQMKIPASSWVCCTKDNTADGKTLQRSATSEASQEKLLFFPKYSRSRISFMGILKHTHTKKSTHYKPEHVCDIQMYISLLPRHQCVCTK